MFFFVCFFLSQCKVFLKTVASHLQCVCLKHHSTSWVIRLKTKAPPHNSSSRNVPFPHLARPQTVQELLASTANKLLVLPVFFFSVLHGGSQTTKAHYRLLLVQALPPSRDWSSAQSRAKKNYIIQSTIIQILHSPYITVHFKYLTLGAVAVLLWCFFLFYFIF